MFYSIYIFFNNPKNLFLEDDTRYDLQLLCNMYYCHGLELIGFADWSSLVKHFTHFVTNDLFTSRFSTVTRAQMTNSINPISSIGLFYLNNRQICSIRCFVKKKVVLFNWNTGIGPKSNHVLIMTTMTCARCVFFNVPALRRTY